MGSETGDRALACIYALHVARFFENERGGRRRRRERDEIRMNFERAKEVLRHAVTLPGSPARK